METLEVLNFEASKYVLQMLEWTHLNSCFAESRLILSSYNG